MRSRAFTALIVALALAPIAIAACGDDEEDATAPPPPAATQPAQTDATGTSPAAAGETVEVAADPGGALAYVQDSLSAPAGPVTFEFTNESGVPHDFNIEQDGEQVDATKVITRAEESLNVELEPGRYTYYCSVANHREAGMEGPLIVE